MERRRPDVGKLMRTITSRFVMLVATAAVAPLVLYGAVSIYSLRTGSRQSVIDGNRNVAARAAEQIEQYMDHHVSVLRSIADTLHDTQLEPWQQTQILTNHVLDFEGFRELTLFGRDGAVVATSRLGGPTLQPPLIPISEPHIAPITVDDDFLPMTTVSLPLTSLGEPNGWLVGEVSLEELWRMVDRIRVGREGFAMVVAGGGQLIAHGDPDQKPRIAAAENLSDHELVVAVAALRARERADGTQPALLAAALVSEYLDDDGRELLAVAAAIASPEWTVIVEQPVNEAFGLSNQLEAQLVVAITVALLLTVALGYYWGRSFIRPIQALTRGTEAIASGRLEERVDIGGTDEFHRLGESFNSMAVKLNALQEDVRRKERQATFGRIAAGLVHDLSHPIQNVGNSCRLIVRLFDDPEYRATFRRTVDREFASIKRVLENLRNLARPMSLERFPVDVNRSVAEVTESMQALADTAGVRLDMRLSADQPFIEGDIFALGRVYRNLILNAIEATAPGGVVTLSTEECDGRIRISVRDTGTGIAHDRLENIFEDFQTTKRTGLGLGLAISRKIVNQLGGDISVTSAVGHGTTFSLEFAQVEGRPEVPAARAAAS
ncbi:MAG: sensor histidine kinase [Acidobacteria bacterium]|nr:MAG: sensor histidine kinase [Acidobacteriota bacterium]